MKIQAVLIDNLPGMTPNQVPVSKGSHTWKNEELFQEKNDTFNEFGIKAKDSVFIQSPTAH